MELPKTLKDEIWEYCRLNNITNIDEFTLKLLKQGFTIEKFGATPQTNIVEKIVEVPVEKIVEKIVEIPITDDNLSEELNKYMGLLEDSKNEVTRLLGINEELKQEVIREKEKNKRDMYGEK